MSHNRSRFLCGAAALPLALAPRPSGAQTLLPLRIGSTANDSYAEGMYGKDQGFFTQAGLDADLRIFTNGVSVAAALAGNAIDIGIMSPVTFATAVDKSVDFVLLAAGGLDNPNETGFCVMDDSGIRTGKDFDGKTIGASGLRDMGSLAAMAWIDKTGGDSSKVKMVEVPFSAMGETLRRGTVNAAIIAEPNLTAQLKQGGMHPFTAPHLMDVYGKDIVMIGAWVANGAWTRSNPETVHRFLSSLYATARWANTHPAETAAILSKYSKVPPEVASSMYRAPYAESLKPSMLQGILDLSYKYKFISRPMKAADLFYHA
jgi:NitT/TauT family transport system substrate-binding protein